MSGQSDIDHPLCEECTDILLDQLDHQLKVTTDELNDYSKEFVDKVDSSKDENTDELAKELEDLKMEESQLIQVKGSLQCGHFLPSSQVTFTSLRQFILPTFSSPTYMNQLLLHSSQL